ncbi:MAG TPA: hypothetical protein VG994_15670 [Steroidobacteraceae bacterium]|nr:hypothetical protein [Steroidobacteraceae bacterium]
MDRQGDLHVFNRLFDAPRRALSAVVAVFTLALGACGGGADGLTGGGGNNPAPGSSCTNTTCGTAFVSVMDADSGFDSYTVDVVSLSLKKADGTTVDTLAVKPRIDFADLVELKEFLTAVTIPPGTYVSGTLQLDYTNADIVVDVNGVPTPAVAVDASGNPLKTVSLEVQLDNRKQLTIVAGKPALLELDFDLLASNSIGDTTQSPVQVTVQPVIVASVDVVDSREARVRGPLTSVDTSSGNYHIDLRPFNLANARLGDVTVHTTASTEFEVDGTQYTGAPGIAAMAALSTGSPTVAYGTLDVPNRTFTATRVHAGTSVAGAQFDAVEGTVVARSGSNLTVRGVTLIKKSGSVVFKRGTTTVALGQTTKVVKDGQRDTSLTIGAISVGQRIAAFGTATESGDDVSLDATAGRVRMQVTHLLGTVKDLAIGGMTLDLSAIEGRPISAFTFAGTGAQPAQDADPSSYSVDTASLPLTNLDIGSPARVFGFVTPFGTAPPDFTAVTLVGFRAVPAVLSVGYGPSGASAPFLTIDASAGLVIDNHSSRIDGRHTIVIGPKVLDVRQLASPPTVKADTAGGMFAIGEPRTVQVFATFADFISALNGKLLTEKVFSISATGSYDAATNVLTAKRVLIQMR